jgi:F0F1-type ATP synthase membrane subunit b/b'
MTRASAFLRAVPVLAAVGLLLAAPALAAEGGEPNLFESPLGWAFRWAQFLLIFGGAGYLIAKKAPPYFRGRAEALSASLAESARLKRDAERHLREAEQKHEGIEQELADLRAAAQREAAAEAERIRAATRDEAQKIERAAQAEREAAERAARMELKALAARLAVEQAEALIQRQLTPQTEAELLRSFVDNLARSVN